MAYRVQYGNKDTYSETNKIRIGRTFLISICVLATVLFLTAEFWPEGSIVLGKLTAFRGLKQIRQQLEIMALDLRSGTSLGTAVSVFCREVVQMGMDYAA